MKTTCIPAMCLAVVLLSSSCAHQRDHQIQTRPTGCGELVLGTPCLLEREAALSSRWPLWTGIGVEGAALVSAGVGFGHYYLAGKRRDEAATATGVGEKGLLLDKAERSEEIAAWTLGAAVPLAITGGVFILLDVLGQDDDDGPKGSGDQQAGFDFAPTLSPTPQGGAVIGATVTW